jgi:hypothetical protein
MQNLKLLLNNVFATGTMIIVLGLGVTNVTIPALAQVTTPESAKTSLANPVHGIDMSACVRVFDWDTYVKDYVAYNDYIKANPTSTAKFSSAPFIDKQCVKQNSFATNGTITLNRAAPSGYDTLGKITKADYTVNPLTVIKTPTYQEFNTAKGTPANTAKATLGNLPVLGQTALGGFEAQSLNAIDLNNNIIKGQNNDRIQLQNHLNVYNAAELATMYGTGTVRTGAPRWVYTGRDGVLKTVDGTVCKTTVEGCYYEGAKCTAVNGQMAIRTKLTLPDGVVDAPDDFDKSNPLSECRIDSGKELFDVDKNFEVLQFIYIFNLPTDANCKGLNSKITFTQCTDFYKKRFNFQNASPVASPTKRILTYTYYGFFADASFRCQTAAAADCDDSVQRFGPKGGFTYKGVNTGWKNTDLNGPRQTFSTKATEAELRTYYGDKTSSYQQLQERYNGSVRNLDGYGVYTL